MCLEFQQCKPRPNLFLIYRSLERVILRENLCNHLPYKSLISLRNATHTRSVFFFSSRDDIPLNKMRLRLRISSPKELHLLWFEFAILLGILKVNMKLIGRLGRVVLIRVICPPKDRFLLFKWVVTSDIFQ